MSWKIKAGLQFCLSKIPFGERFNYVQYSEKQWSLFSPALHYQNRIRHRDYLDLFQNAGFEIVDE